MMPPSLLILAWFPGPPATLGNIDRPMAGHTRGNISVLLAGRIHAAGLTTDELETEIETRLQKYVNEPDVTVALTEIHHP